MMIERCPALLIPLNGLTGRIGLHRRVATF